MKKSLLWPLGFIALFVCIFTAITPLTAAAIYYPPDQRGPYSVGVTYTLLTDESRFEIWGLRHRPIPLEIWYPSSGRGGIRNTVEKMLGDMPEWTWWVMQLAYGDKFDSVLNTQTSAYRDLPPNDLNGPYPVIFFSHGLSAIRFQNYTLCEHLASHGFIVVAPDHYGNALFTNDDGAVILFNPATILTGISDEPKDIEFIYNSLLADAVDLPFPLPMDLERVGMSGHSYGGLNTMLSGPQFDFIDAIAPLNPFFFDWYPEDFTKPMLMLQSDSDEIVGLFDPWALGAFEQANSDRKLHIELKRAGHYSASDACRLFPDWFIRPSSGCDNPEMIDFTWANFINDAYLTAFFKATVEGDTAYEAYLMDNHFPEDIDLTVVWQFDGM